MSSVSRAGPRGGKGAAKSSESVPPIKPQKTDTTKTETPKSSDNVPKVSICSSKSLNSHFPFYLTIYFSSSFALGQPTP